MTTIINIFGGPSAGKSVAAMRIALALKVAGIKSELVTEVAKDFTWEGRNKTLDIQPYVTVKQYRNLERVLGQVDYLVTDGPLLMGHVYARAYAPDMPPSYYEFVGDMHRKNPSINLVLDREFPYQAYGRNQDETEALSFDDKIIRMLDSQNVRFTKIKPSEVQVWIDDLISHIP